MSGSPKKGVVVIDGGGIAAIQAALDVANSGYPVFMIEKMPFIGGKMLAIEKTFPTNDCSMCILSPKLVECVNHPNITISTCTEVSDIKNICGRYIVTATKMPRYIDEEKCNSCGRCAEVCPVAVNYPFTTGPGTRKAVYKPYARTFPDSYLIDERHCTTCGYCARACQAGAINFDKPHKPFEIVANSIILCQGYENFEPDQMLNYSYGIYPNVITSYEFECIVNAAGPFKGRIVRPSDHNKPDRIAWIQCVGSRNIRIDQGYCSTVCCMHTLKGTLLARESGMVDDTTVFFSDIRTCGKGYEQYYERARTSGTRFVRSRISGLTELPGHGRNLQIRYAGEDGTIHNETFNLVVLSTGFQPPRGFSNKAGQLGLTLNKYGFCKPAESTGVNTNLAGIFTAGAVNAPMDITGVVLQAAAAAFETVRYLSLQGKAGLYPVGKPVEKNVVTQEPRIGIFICHCGINIASAIETEALLEAAWGMPGVVFAGDYIYACSRDSLLDIQMLIKKHRLNRVVIAACSPQTHKYLFHNTLREAGLNSHLLEMANIREHCAWVHPHTPGLATAKAKDLLLLAVSRAALLQPLASNPVPVNKNALVIGGGVAGMSAALGIAERGFTVQLVEKTGHLGGNARRINGSLEGENVESLLNNLIHKVRKNPQIKLNTGCEVASYSGKPGGFLATLSNGLQIMHGVAVVATGASEHQSCEYGYGRDPRVITQLELERAIRLGSSLVAEAGTVVLIQCVGSREPGRGYCSRICCTRSLRLALRLKDLKRSIEIFVLYRDIRSFGFYEELYRKARAEGVIFVRYEPENKPVVETAEESLEITAYDPILGCYLVINADLFVLAPAIVASESSLRLSRIMRMPVDEDGFYKEAHVKLRPAESPIKGIYLAGLAHGPKPMQESIVQAKAAAGKASLLLEMEYIESEGIGAVVDPEKCAHCLNCTRTCPYGAPRSAGAAVGIELLHCEGCGICAAGCPSRAISMQNNDPSLYLAACMAMLKGAQRF